MLILCRHGETDWNRDGRHQGQTDIPLNERGWQQAMELAHRLQGERVQAVYSSCLLRAYQTAQVVGSMYGVEPIRDPRLNELNQGAWEGLRADEIQKRFPEEWRRWQLAPLEPCIPGGESLAELRQRVGSLVRDIIRRHGGQTVCLVGHKVSLGALAQQLGVGSSHPCKALDLPPGGFTKVVVDRHLVSGLGE